MSFMGFWEDKFYSNFVIKIKARNKRNLAAKECSGQNVRQLNLAQKPVKLALQACGIVRLREDRGVCLQVVLLKSA